LLRTLLFSKLNITTISSLSGNEEFSVSDATAKDDSSVALDYVPSDWSIPSCCTLRLLSLLDISGSSCWV